MATWSLTHINIEFVTNLFVDTKVDVSVKTVRQETANLVDLGAAILVIGGQAKHFVSAVLA